MRRPYDRAPWHLVERQFRRYDTQQRGLLQPADLVDGILFVGRCLSAAEVEALKDAWVRRFSGARNVHVVMRLDDGATGVFKRLSTELASGTPAAPTSTPLVGKRIVIR
jgi:hypothetical protein